LVYPICSILSVRSYRYIKRAELTEIYNTALKVRRLFREFCDNEHLIPPWDGLELRNARMRPGSNPDLPRATSRLFARAPGRVAYWVSGGFPFTNRLCIPPCGARANSKRVWRSPPNNLFYFIVCTVTKIVGKWTEMGHNVPLLLFFATFKKKRKEKTNRGPRPTQRGFGLSTPSGAERKGEAPSNTRHRRQR
jgi:hypothetical protein